MTEDDVCIFFYLETDLDLSLDETRTLVESYYDNAAFVAMRYDGGDIVLNLLINKETGDLKMTSYND